jgi:hypothetical protein
MSGKAVCAYHLTPARQRFNPHLQQPQDWDLKDRLNFCILRAHLAERVGHFSGAYH